MKITLTGALCGAGALLATAYLMVQADHVSAPAPAQPIVNRSQDVGTGRPPYWHVYPPTWCAEDMPCWIGSAVDDRNDRASMRDWVYQLHHLRDYERPVPRWLTCNVINASEFPRKAARAWQVCYTDINRWHSRWAYVGRFAGRREVWVITGPTSVYVTRSGWFVIRRSS